jgi:hypothetical protein
MSPGSVSISTLCLRPWEWASACLQIRVGLIFEGLCASTLGIHCLPNNERWRMSTDPHNRGKPLASVCQWASFSDSRTSCHWNRTSSKGPRLRSCTKKRRAIPPLSAPWLSSALVNFLRTHKQPQGAVGSDYAAATTPGKGSHCAILLHRFLHVCLARTKKRAGCLSLLPMDFDHE